ncbi:CoA transferase [Verminephrobacter eiseniae]|nr:CoA transferase [Verminephrobacter eiseniae]MCW5301787.1 CoA transferase [Verminephrobacter eiseniae]MCW8180458.1 CoA transferase [Verminephrobacter eiseniae]
MADNDMAQPLAGIRVVEIGQNIAGPYASEILSSLGAEVIKIERPGTGDDARGWGPPFWRGTATTFQAMNHGKKSIALDLRNACHVQWLHGRVVEADVFIQNMRPGSLQALGLGPGELCALNPRLIYCSLWAFGHKGPMQMAPGYEPMVQAFAGIFSINGPETGPPARVGMQVLDLGTGMWAALGCMAALLRRASTGQGCVVDTSLFETALTWLQVMMAGFQATGKQPQRHRSGNPNVVVFQALSTKDGELVVAAANDRLFASSPVWRAVRNGRATRALPAIRCACSTRTICWRNCKQSSRRAVRRTGQTHWSKPAFPAPPFTTSGRSWISRRPRRSASSRTSPGWTCASSDCRCPSTARARQCATARPTSASTTRTWELRWRINHQQPS